MITKECILLDMEETEKNDCILALVKLLKKQGNITDVNDFFQDVLDREKLSPTSVGSNIGLPHGRTNNVLSPAVCIGRLKKPIIWNDETKEMAQIVLLIAVPGEDKNNTHLQILGKLARKLMHQEFVDKLETEDLNTIYLTMKEVLEGA